MPLNKQYPNESDKDFEDRQQQQSTNNKVFDTMEQASSDSLNLLEEGASDYVEEILWEPLQIGDWKAPELTKRIVGLGKENPNHPKYNPYGYIKTKIEKEETVPAKLIDYQSYLIDIGLYKGQKDDDWGPQMDKADSLFTELKVNKNLSYKQIQLFSDLKERNETMKAGPEADSIWKYPELFEKYYNKRTFLNEEEYRKLYGRYADENAPVIKNALKKHFENRDKWVNKLIQFWKK